MKKRKKKKRKHKWLILQHRKTITEWLPKEKKMKWKMDIAIEDNEWAQNKCTSNGKSTDGGREESHKAWLVRNN